jgi:ABC-type uncharacterized transport system involved in gliding motility auxiliary subunit
VAEEKPKMKLNREEVARFCFTLGAALLISGYLRYSIQGTLLTTSKILLIAGGVLILAAIVLGFRSILGFFSRRSSRLGTNTTVFALAVLFILGLLNFVGYRHHKRFDLTTEKMFTLSDQTQKIVRGLRNDVVIIRFAKLPDQQLDDLMSEYKNLSPHMKFQNVDPNEKPEIAQQYGAKRMDDVIVASGPRTEHLESGARGNASEADVTSAILKVTRDTVKTICFVTGHGEKSLADTGETGYSGLDAGLKKESYDTRSINLVSENEVPSDCSVLVIAGPTQSYFPQETAMVSKYLDNGGKALIEVDPVVDEKQQDPKLDDIFNAWNINVGKNVVIDASGMGRLVGAGPAIPLVVNYGPSPITKSFEGSMTFFPLARIVSIADKGKSDPEDVELLKTSPRSFTVPNLKREVSYDPKTGTLGPLSLGVAATRKSTEKGGRLVVIGDSDFAGNRVSGMQRNGDLFYNTINWLAQDENLISIRPKSVTNRRVTLTEGQSKALGWVDLFGLPGIVIVAGVYIWWKRR